MNRSIVILGALALAVPLRAQEEILVVNESASPPSITVYHLGGTGNEGPIRTVTGLSTGLNTAQKLDIDTVNDQIAVANEAGNTITVYARAAANDQAPARTITDTATPLNLPEAVAFDPRHNEIFVATEVAGFGTAVAVYDRLQNTDTAAKRILSGANTHISDAAGLFFDAVHGELFIGSAQNGAILVFDRLASGNVAPKREISGLNTLLIEPEGLAVDAVHDELYVADNASGVLVFPRAATGNQTPTRHIGGGNIDLSLGLNSAEDVAVDAARGQIYVADNYGSDNNVTEFGKILVFDRLANGANVVAQRSIHGAGTGLHAPQGIRILPWQFADGFELGNTNRWSHTVP